MDRWLVLLVVIICAATVAVRADNLPFEQNKFPNTTTGKHRDVVLKVIEDGSTYYVEPNGMINYFSRKMPFHMNWYDEEDIRLVNKDEIYNYRFGKVLPNIEETGKSNPRRCPCGSKVTPLSEPEKVNYCFVKSLESEIVISALQNSSSSLFYRRIDNSTYGKYYSEHTIESVELSNCSILIEFTSNDNLVKHTCPEACKPVPYTLLSVATIQAFAENMTIDGNHDDIPVTCSMTWKEVRRLFSPLLTSNKRMTAADRLRVAIEFLLEISYKRRIMECHEQSLWPVTLSKSFFFSELVQYHFERRKVHGLLVTAGGRYRYWMVRDQHAILRHQRSFQESHIIVGWGGLEDQYPCIQDRAKPCRATHYNGQHKPYMPSTSLYVPNREMYNCAQRRPLRALAHTLLLYDPNFIILGDDDTFISKTVLFSTHFQRFVRKHVMTHNEVFSEIMRGVREVTIDGFYFGGTGYLFGKPVIDRLTSTRIAGPTQRKYSWSGTNRTRELSILFEAAELAATECPDCIRMPDEYYHAPVDKKYMLNIEGELNHSMRLIDVCTHMMSGHNTCYNSDHAVSRCLAHGSYTRLQHAPCNGAIRYGRMQYPLSMCFWHTAPCRTSKSLTCHRFRVNTTDPEHGYSILRPGYTTVVN